MSELPAGLFTKKAKPGAKSGKDDHPRYRVFQKLLPDPFIQVGTAG